MAKKRKPLPSLEWLSPRLRFARLLAGSSFVALVVLLTVWTFAFDNLHGANPWLVLAIRLVPLALVAPGMIKGSPRAHAWACFIMNLYFIQGVLAATDPARMVYGVLLVALSVDVFIAGLLYIRWAYQYSRKAAGEE